MSQGMSQQTYNIILNIRDAIALIAIISIIPTLSYRMAGIFLEQGLTKQYRDTKQELREKEREKDYFERWQETYSQLQTAKSRRAERMQGRDIGPKETASERQAAERIQELEDSLQKASDVIKNQTGKDVSYEMVQKHLYDLNKRINELENELQEIETQEIQYYFYTSVIIGVSALLIGIFIPLLHAGIAFLIGGIITLGYGYWIYWDQMSSMLATLSLIIALIGLVAGMWLYRPTQKA